MLSDRTYMRDNYPRERTSGLAWLISAIVAGFVLQHVFNGPLQMNGVLEHYFGLSVRGLQTGHFWTLATYSLLHDTGNFLQIVFDLLGLYFLGRALIPLLGATRFLGLYAGMVLTGAAVWTAVHWQGGGNLLGDSAGIFGLFTVFACFYPNQPVTFLLFFIVPVTLKPKYVAIAAVLIDLVGCICYEVMGASSPFGFAHSAHLGGMLAGWVYYRYLHDVNWSLPTRRADIELPKWMKKAKSPAPAAFSVNVSAPGDLRAEVDRILDKINSSGFGALTADEKRLLDDAKDLLSRR